MYVMDGVNSISTCLIIIIKKIPRFQTPTYQPMIDRLIISLLAEWQLLNVAEKLKLKVLIPPHSYRSATNNNIDLGISGV